MLFRVILGSRGSPRGFFDFRDELTDWGAIGDEGVLVLAGRAG